MYAAVICLLVLISQCSGDTSDCKVTISGKSYDLSPLKNDYMIHQTVYDTTDNIFTNTNYSDAIDITLQVGICQNVASPMAGCAGTSPVFMMRGDNKKCVSLGSLEASVFEANPFGDGVYLDYYNGDMIDHITRYEARLYFVCNGNTTIAGPDFEHLKDSNQAHFHITTKYAC